MVTIISHSPAETFAHGRALAASLRAGDVLALDGDLGAGKTQFVKGVAAGLGCTGDVTSPTFTLVHEYTGGRVPLFHFDFYRLESGDEALRIGLDDYLGEDGVIVIEWAGKFPALLPAGTRWFRLRVPVGNAASDGDMREIEEVARA
ncbi:MAG: tRNA (adenosine(37)-N6)-threonylcarbamoyltransferase complex ATPase subunit type 1 TsaE [Chthoniobacteraceae bacterium]